MDQEINFFEGQKPLTKVVFIYHNGKASLTVTPWEEWRLIDPTPFTLRCGNKRDRKITQRIGIEHSQHSSFESSIGSSLGKKGIAAIESSIKSTIGKEIKFQLGSEVEETFSFDSPTCGYKLVKLYQKVRVLHLKHEDKRYWHKSAVEFPLVQWLRSIYDATIVEPYDPGCNCEKTHDMKSRNGDPARIVSSIFGKLAVLRRDNDQLEFPENAKSLNGYFTWSDEVAGQISSDLIPDYLRFLSGIEKGELLDVKAFQEPVLFTSTPDFKHPAGEVEVEFNESFEQVVRASTLKPVLMERNLEESLSEDAQIQNLLEDDT